MIMELLIINKASKYLVQDKKGRMLYTVRRKSFSQQYNLMDASNYNLYTFVQTGDERKPGFTIILNDNVFMQMVCRSMFLDPTIEGGFKDHKYEIASKDRKDFDIILNGNVVGHIKTKQALSGDLQYDLDIDNKAFDDYIPLFAVAVDKAFGSMNKQK